MKKTFYIIILFVLFLYTSCNKKEDHLFEKAESFININNDSVNYYLRQIKYPEKLPPPLRSKYGLMQVNHFPRNNEREHYLDYSIDYYKKAQDTVKLIQSYKAKAYYQDSIQQKIEFYTIAKKLALKIEDKQQAAFIHLDIGYYYERLGELDKAQEYISKAFEFSSEDNFLYGLTQWNQSRLYRKKEMLDEAAKCLLIAAEQAVLNSPSSLSPIYKQLSDIYSEQENYQEALKYINLSIEHRTNIKELPTYNLTKAIVFMNTQEVDSARQYLSYAIESPNEYVSSRALDFLAQLDTKINLYEKAYHTRIKADESFISIQRSQNDKHIALKYQEEKLKNENSQLKIEKQQQENYSLIITIVLLFTCALVIILYLYKQKQQAKIQYTYKEQLLHEKALLHETQNQLLRQEKELALLHEKAAILRASLFKKMSLSQKVPSLNKEETEKVGNSKINLTEQDITELKRTVDAAYNNFTKRLSCAFSVLSEDDITFCCLVKIQVDMQDLSDIYCISKAGITKRKMRLKKDKLNIENNISLDQFIQEF